MSPEERHSSQMSLQEVSSRLLHHQRQALDSERGLVDEQQWEEPLAARQNQPRKLVPLCRRHGLRRELALHVEAASQRTEGPQA